MDGTREGPPVGKCSYEDREYEIARCLKALAGAALERNEASEPRAWPSTRFAGVRRPLKIFALPAARGIVRGAGIGLR